MAGSTCARSVNSLDLAHVLRAEQIGSQAHFHPGALHDLEPGDCAIADAAQLFHAGCGKAQLFSLLSQGREGGHGGHGECAALGHEFRRLAVDQCSVLDGAHAQRHRPAHRFRGMAMRGDVGARARGLFDGGANFVFRILAAFQRIGGRCDAAGCHQLDVRCAAPQLLAHGAAHRVYAIGDYGERIEMAGAS